MLKIERSQNGSFPFRSLTIPFPKTSAQRSIPHTRKSKSMHSSAGSSELRFLLPRSPENSTQVMTSPTQAQRHVSRSEASCLGGSLRPKAFRSISGAFRWHGDPFLERMEREKERPTLGKTEHNVSKKRYTCLHRESLRSGSLQHRTVGLSSKTLSASMMLGIEASSSVNEQRTTRKDQLALGSL